MFFKSINKLFLMASPATGDMPTFTDAVWPAGHDLKPMLVSKSFNVNFPKGTVLREWADGADVASLAIAGRTEGSNFTFKLERMPINLLALLMGAPTGGSGPTKASKPGVRTTNYMSMRIMADQAGGTQGVWDIPHGLLTTGIVGNMTADAEGKAEIDCTFEVLSALDENGVVQDAWQIYDELDE